MKYVSSLSRYKYNYLIFYVTKVILFTLRHVS